VISAARSPRAILLLWSPLAVQWLLMAIEAPFLAAVIARLVEPTFNLAAYGVAYAFAILVESPVIMLMSASTALVDGPESYRRLRNFSLALNGLATALLLLVLTPPVFALLMDVALGLPEEVSALVYGALWLLLPWPAAIGYRRFLHGILIRSGRTRRVAFGTGLRLVAMAATAVLLVLLGVPGAWVGAGALSAGVVIEAIAAAFMAAGAVRGLHAAAPPAGGHPSELRPESGPEAGAGGEALEGLERATLASSTDETVRGYAGITRFYYPLALTSFIALSVQPLLTFFMGRAPSPVESLAVFPVVHALSFLFSSFGLSYQEAAIALLGRRCEHARELGRFGAGLALAAAAGLALVAFTPLASVWFEAISGLPPHLAEAALLPARLAVPLPALSVFLSFQRAILVQARTTRPITAATAVEVMAIAILFPLFSWGLGLMGVAAALLAFVCGRVSSVLFLIPWTRRALAP
jgi:progressive ankylosis protein